MLNALVGKKYRINRLMVILGIAILLASIFNFYSVLKPTRTEAAQEGPHVVGNHLETASGRYLRLLGVNRSSFEYACVQGLGTHTGPTDQSNINAMRSWHINTVRIPLNEDCWLGINGTSVSAQAYQNDLAAYVNTISANGLMTILDLHWTAPGGTRATQQMAMPDADHSRDFWNQVANAYKNNTSVVFDLFNEPYPESGGVPAGNAWDCLRNGNCPGLGYAAAGMQSLVDSIRSTGARNLIMSGGLNWASDLSQWNNWKPNDFNIAASWHSYETHGCSDSGCWNNNIAPLANSTPVILGELGEYDCNHDYVDNLMGWADGHGVSYLGFTFNANDGWNCGSPTLVNDWNGSPTGFGQGIHDHLLGMGDPMIQQPVNSNFDNWPWYWWSVTNQNSGKCLDDAFNTNHGTIMIQWECNYSPSQKWQVSNMGGGWWRIRNQHSNLCLDDTWGTANGTNVIEWDCNGVAVQNWSVRDRGDGYYEIKNQNSGKCLDASWNGSNGVKLYIWDCFSNPPQGWAIN